MPLTVHPVGGYQPNPIKALLFTLVVFFGATSLLIIWGHVDDVSVRPSIQDTPTDSLSESKPRWRHPQCADPCSSHVCSDIRRSTLHSECCEAQGIIPKPPRTYPLIVSATPRSGTTGAVALLRHLGLRLSHDFTNPFRDGMVSWIHIFSEFDDIHNQSNSVAFPYYGYGKLNASRFTSGLHLVREPLSSITSLSCAVLLNTHVTKQNSSMSISFRRFVERHTGMDANATSVNMFKAGMQMWLDWHRFMDRLCIDLVRTEDLFNPATTWDILKRIFDMLGRPYPSPTQIGKALGRTGKKTNTRKHRKTVSWKELFAVDPDLAWQVHQLGSRYGYQLQGDADKLRKLSTVFPVPREFWPQC